MLNIIFEIKSYEKTYYDTKKDKTSVYTYNKILIKKITYQSQHSIEGNTVNIFICVIFWLVLH